MERKSFFTVQKLALTGLIAALVFVACWMSVEITIPGGHTRVHLGNSMMLLGGLLLGGIPGGLAAGIGAMLFDFTNPLYVSSAPFTFAFRFLMGLTCGAIAHRGKKNGLSVSNNTVAALIGTLVYLMLFLTRTFITERYINGQALSVATALVGRRGLISLINAAIGIAVSVPLAATIRKVAPRNLF